MKPRILLLALLACATPAYSTDGSVITSDEASRALRDGLYQGTRASLSRLGRENGYFGNPRVKIGLPKNFARAEGVLRSLGLGKEVDDLILAMNRTAEAAVPEVSDLMQQAVRRLSIDDAKALLAAGDGATTAWFRKNTEAQFDEKLAPLVHAAAERGDLVRAYNAMAGKLALLARIKSDRATVEDYVDHRALDGFYTLLAEEEHSIRMRRPGGKVFGMPN